MKTKNLFLAVFILGIISWSCSNKNLSTTTTSASLKSSLTSSITALTTAVNKISSSAGYQVLAGPTDLITKSAVVSPLDTLSHSILLSDIAGVYDYKATTVTIGSHSILQFFTKTADNAQMIVRLPQEKVNASRKLLKYTPGDTLLTNNYVVTLSEYVYNFKYFSAWDYKMASAIAVKDVDVGVLSIQSSNNQTSGYQFASQFKFPSGYITKCTFTSGDTAICDYTISDGTKILYEEKYTAVKSNSELRHRERAFSLTIGNVLIERNAGSDQTLDSVKVYVDGVLQLNSKVDIVDNSSDTTDRCVTNKKRELKITFDDGTSATITELAGQVITDISTLFTSMRQSYFATGIIDWIAWDIFLSKQ